jgi:protein SCO1/2
VTPIRVTVSLCLAFIAIVVGMFVVSMLREPQLSDNELRDLGVFLLPTPRELEPFSLRDHLGQEFTRERLEGKWTFAFFGFTHCPDVCPTSMSQLAQADRELVNAGTGAEDFQVILVTVDPQRDTAEELGGYVTVFSERFLGVLGERAALGKFAQQVNAAFAKVPVEGGYSVDHTGNIVIFNPRGHYHGFIKLPHKAQTIRLAYQSLAARF